MSQFHFVLSVSPLPDGMQWRLNERLRYTSTLLGGAIDVPPLFVTDFASIPRIAWSILPPWGLYGSAAIVHDWLYWTQPCSRDMADDVLREAMTLLGVETGVIDQIHQAVHLFGQHAWDHNAYLRAHGYTRTSSGGDVPPYAGVPK